MGDTALFDIAGDGTFVATDYARGPWDPTACHGGPVAALLARTAERCDADGVDWHLARLTVELTRPVPVHVPLTIDAFTERPGRKVSLVAAVLRAGENEVARARALRIRRADVDLPGDVPPGITQPLPTFETAVPWRMQFTGTAAATAFHSDACEHLYAEGIPGDPGPAGVWIRLLVPVVDGEEPSGAQRAMAAADFGNGVSAALPFEQYVFINPDLTVHLARPPAGEWIGMRSESLYTAGGTGFAESALFDVTGQLGRGVQSLFVDSR